MLSKLASIVSRFISDSVAWVGGQRGVYYPQYFCSFEIQCLFASVSVLEAPHLENVSISDETYNLRHFFLCHSVFLSLTPQLKVRVKVLGHP